MIRLKMRRAAFGVFLMLPLVLVLALALAQGASGQESGGQESAGKDGTQENWLKGSVAELQTLDKITARISTLSAEVGQPFTYGALRILILSCNYRPPTMAPEHAALMQIKNIDHQGAIVDEAIFQGWMFASSPALNALEHPVYDVSVLACKKS